LDHFGVSLWRIVALGLAVASGATLGYRLAVGTALGPATGAAEVLVGCLTFYIVVSLPRRVLDSQRMAQSRSAMALSVGAAVLGGVTGSRSRTLIMLRSRDRPLGAALGEVARQVLLGKSPGTAVAEVSETLPSYSAASALRRAASLRSLDGQMGDEETRGLQSSLELNRETKLPMFMTVCFFAPMMALLYAVFFHVSSLGALSELTAVVFVAVDLAYYFATVDGGK
jgi:hypothetical protein